MKVVNDYDTNFYKFMVKYYAFKPMRVFVSFSTFICQIMLLMYLMVIPIQLAYHSLISSPQTKYIQDNVDFVVCAFFSFHLLLYFDNSIEKIIKAPNSLPKYRIDRLGKWTRLITLQIFYDIITWSISVYMASPEQNTFQQRILELVFFLKVYKLYKFHKRTIYILIGTAIYPTYKVFFTVMVTFTTISYLSSIFYVIDLVIYTNGGPLSNLIWLVNANSTEPGLINKPLWVQLLMINYWAMGTSSTAAYGDICGLSPQQVVFNIFVLYFANFLYGYYLNNIHSIPKQARQQELKVLEQFDQFQKYNNLAKQDGSQSQQIDKELYLKILCCIQYKQSQRTALKRIQSAIPSKYIEQIKLQIYTELFNSESRRLYNTKGFFWKEKTLLKMSKLIKESVCQTDQNLYEYDHINQTDLIYIHEGSVDLRLPKQLKNVVAIRKQQGEMFGQYCFITNQNRKIQAIALEYVSVYIIQRKDYKKCVTFEEFQNFDSMFNRCLDFTEQKIENQVFKKYNDRLEEKSSLIDMNKPSAKFRKIQKVFKQRKSQRIFANRQKLKSQKIFISDKANKKRSISVQTQFLQQSWGSDFQSVISFW